MAVVPGVPAGGGNWARAKVVQNVMLIRKKIRIGIISDFSVRIQYDTKIEKKPAAIIYLLNLLQWILPQ